MVDKGVIFVETKGERMNILKGFLASALAVSAVEVMTWQPYYNYDQGFESLQKNKKHISRLGFQYWNTDTSGKLVLLAPDSQITRFKAITDSQGIKNLLCVFNYNLSDTKKGWDWAIAKKAFIDRRAEFVSDLLAQVEKYDLDGIDLDLEGGGAAHKDTAGKLAYLSFAKELSDSLHARGRLLTADTYSYIWNGPSWLWWPDMAPMFDAIHVMGYDNTGACQILTNYSCYVSQEQSALNSKLTRKQLFMGVAPESDTVFWGRYPINENLAELKRLVVPLAFWDLPGLNKTVWGSDSIQAKLDTLFAQPDSGQVVELVPVLKVNDNKIFLQGTQLYFDRPQGWTFELFDTKGARLVWGSARRSVSLTHLPEGAYTLRLLGNGQSYSQQIQILH